MRYEWSFSETKVCEGGRGVRDAVKAAKRAGAKARRQESVFVGNEMIVVETRTLAEMQKALAALKSIGFIENVADEMSVAVTEK